MDGGREKNHRGIEEIIEKTFRFSRNTRQVMEKKRKICISIMEIRFSSVDFLQRVACLPRVPEMDYHCLGATLCRPNVKKHRFIDGMWLTGGNSTETRLQ